MDTKETEKITDENEGNIEPKEDKQEEHMDIDSYEEGENNGFIESTLKA